MRIVVNGEDKDVDDGSSLTALVDDLGLAERRVVVELNQTIIDKTEYSETALADGDSLEIIQFVPGG